MLSSLELARRHLDAIHHVSRLCALVEPTIDTIPGILASLNTTLPVSGAILYDGSALPARLVGWRAPCAASEETFQAASANLTDSVRRLLGGAVEVPAMRRDEEIALSPPDSPPVARTSGTFHYAVMPLALDRKPFGAFQVVTTHRLSEIDLALLSAVTNQIALALVRDRAWERKIAARDDAASLRRDQEDLLRQERTARVDAEVAQRRLGFLAESSRVVMGTLEYAKALPRIAMIGAREMADFCAIDVPESSPHATIAVRTSQLDADAVRGVESVLARIVEKVLESGEARVASICCESVAEAVSIETRKALRRAGILSMLSVPLRAKGTVVGVLTLMSATENRYTPADLFVAEDLGQRLTSAVEAGRLYRQATESIRDRDRLLEVLSEDLRAPLAEMVLTATAARTKRQGDDLTKDLEALRVGAARLSRSLVDLLDSAQAENRTLQIEPADVQLAELMASAVAAVQPAIREKKIALDIRIRRSANALFADPKRIEQVLTTLLTNAVANSLPGGPVTIQAQRMEKFVRISVTDEGRAIPAEVLPHLFDRFWRARNPEGGATLTLSVEKAIVEAHGGLIWVESAEGKGSTFTFSLPVR